ncbi:WYL domain-containing protein [Kitasatospora sp. GP82]|uniref:helix-turn-helix transcriptional regulator n=1 Tax=Kitasatospora sp. GP82 TaxID=3035089 RepID=UPI002475FADD|nr:WYL domain-containing protein [Kitasatospora sp. GP82]MDH6125306.1 putative DNA-binding transcriptional regulator YafY [Kitasatospora sp. GP82]
MKADRLLSILLLLQTRGRIPAAELAERMEVSIRTIYRDVEALSAAGVPVWSERGRHGGVNLIQGYRTDVTGLTAEEARALFVLLAPDAHDALGLGTALGSALRKVMAALPSVHRPAAERTFERILVDPTHWMRGEPATVDLAELQRAVFADRRLRLAYGHSGADGPSEYTVDPYGLVNKAGVWYLIADLAAEPRLFRVCRVLAAETLEEPVRRRPELALAEVWSALREQVERPAIEVRVAVRVHRRRLEQLQQIHGAQVVPTQLIGSALLDPELIGSPATADGEWTELELGFRTLAEARSLLAFGSEVEVLAPPEARAELARAAAEIAELYGPRPGGM